MKSFKKYKEELEERGYSVLDGPTKSNPNENITLYKDHGFVARVRYTKNNGGVQKTEKRTKQTGGVLFVEYHVLKAPTLDSIQTTFTICPDSKTTN